MAIQISGTTVIDNSRNLTNIASIFSCTGIASQAEAEAGTSSTKLMTPLRVAQAIAALSGGSVIKAVQRGATSQVSAGAYSGATTWSGVTATITAVDLTKTFLTQSSGEGNSWQGNTSVGGYSGSARLTSSTQLAFSGPNHNGAWNPYSGPPGSPATVYWEVVEFN